jgi:hypothetical protein
MRSGHSFPPLRDGLVMYLTRNLTPEASGALQADQSVTILFYLYYVYDQNCALHWTVLIRFMITPLVSSKYSYYYSTTAMYCH